MENKIPDILIVENSEEMLWAMANVLEKANFNVEGVTCGQDAIDTIRKFPGIRLIVLDHLLADMSGLTVMEKIHARGDRPKILGLTARKDMCRRYLRSGAFACMEKPFDIREFVEMCRAAFDGAANCLST